jgi:insulysin
MSTSTLNKVCILLVSCCHSLTSIFLVDHDITLIEKLSKPDLMDFFRRYIHPSSQVRSKLSIHMVAQSSSTTTPNGTTIPEQKASFILGLNQYFNSVGLDSRHELLQERFEDIVVVDGDQEAIVRAVRNHIVNDLELDDEKTNSIVQEGTKLLGTMLMSLGIQVLPPRERSLLNGEKSDTHTDWGEERATQEPVVIDNVHEFKAQQKVSSGARPVKNLCEFEEIEPKL